MFLASLLLCALLLSGCELFWPEAPLGSIKAIFVGLNYQGTDVNTLGGTIHDATEMEMCFSELSVRHEREYHSYSLLQTGTFIPETASYAFDGYSSSLPTRENLFSLIEVLKPTIAEQDLTIFSYSGHGYDDGSLVLATENGKIFAEDETIREEALVSVTELLAAFSSLPGKKLLIFDSCYSGAFVGESGSSVNLIERDTYLDKAFETFFSSDSYAPSLFVLTATTKDNTSKEPGGIHSHGYFTKALLEGLGWDDDAMTLGDGSPAKEKGVLTTDSLFSYILGHQNFPLRGINTKRYQHPTISGGPYALVLF
ncbi:caspase domain-containing protein [Sphaerochaeta sp. PS]|uniref:caspase family protein n=1 Tax=Sphaerochaeta sp. PS TaxID=3076336 RepID=UPI0028A2E931|nr:caspase family protein [Sphaerochaeta sp. PS]MDT4763305.1 caspase family protein [Sphaerochaeta sp. PS]